MILTTLEEIKHHKGGEVLCIYEDDTEVFSESFILNDVNNANLVEAEDERDGDKVYVVSLSKKSTPIASYRSVFFEPRKKVFYMNSFSGPKIILQTPFDKRDYDKSFYNLRKRLLPFWYRSTKRESRKEVSSSSV